MKIIFVSDAIYPYNKGGKEKRLYDISKILAQRRYNVHIFTMNWWKGKKIIKTKDNITLHSTCKLKNLYTNKKRRSIWQAIYFSLSLFIPLLKENFDIIDVDHMPFFPLFSAKLVCVLKRKKMMATWHEVWGREYWMKYSGKISGNIAYLIEKMAVKLPNKILSVSKLTSNRLNKYFGVEKNKIVTIPNGINYDFIVNTKPAIEKSDCIFVGRLLEHKNVNILVESIREVKENLKNDIKCVIIGRGPEKDNLKKLTSDLDLNNNIKFTDSISSREVFSLMKSSKVFVLPSEREGFGITVLEANACGIPVITICHKSNAATDIMKEGYNGYCVNLNEKEIARKIINIIKQNNLQEMRINCQKIAKKYDWSQISDKLLNYYEKQ